MARRRQKGKKHNMDKEDNVREKRVKEGESEKEV